MRKVYAFKIFAIFKIIFMKVQCRGEILIVLTFVGDNEKHVWFVLLLLLFFFCNVFLPMATHKGLLAFKLQRLPTQMSIYYCVFGCFLVSTIRRVERRAWLLCWFYYDDMA